MAAAAAIARAAVPSGSRHHQKYIVKTETVRSSQGNSHTNHCTITTKPNPKTQNLNGKLSPTMFSGVGLWVWGLGLIQLPPKYPAFYYTFSKPSNITRGILVFSSGILGTWLGLGIRVPCFVSSFGVLGLGLHTTCPRSLVQLLPSSRARN